MNKLLLAILVSLILSADSTPAFTLSDTMFIEGYYSQQGRSIGRGKLENFLLNQNPSALLADKAKGMRLSAWVVGTPLWCINTGIAAYQLKQVLDAIEKQEMMSSDISGFSLPLIIGSDVTIFIQHLLRSRSDYAIHRAVIAYNAKIAEKYYHDSVIDLRLTKKKSGWYGQDRVLLPNNVLMAVLDENTASRTSARWSVATGFAAEQSISIGGTFLALALVDYLMESRMTHGARVKLNVGIGVTSFGIINAVIADVTRKSSIRKYNGSISEKKPF